MATIQKVKRRSDYVYRVLIRQAGMMGGSLEGRSMFLVTFELSNNGEALKLMFPLGELLYKHYYKRL